MVSHSHIGHCHDINAIIDMMTYTGIDKHGVLIQSRNFSWGKLPYITDFYNGCLEKVISMEQGRGLGLMRLKSGLFMLTY